MRQVADEQLLRVGHSPAARAMARTLRAPSLLLLLFWSAAHVCLAGVIPESGLGKAPEAPGATTSTAPPPAASGTTSLTLGEAAPAATGDDETQAKGILDNFPGVTAPGSQRPLDRVDILAVTPALDRQPPLDAPAAVRRNSKPAASTGLRVADHSLVVEDENMTHQDAPPAIKGPGKNNMPGINSQSADVLEDYTASPHGLDTTDSWGIETFATETVTTGTMADKFTSVDDVVEGVSAEMENDSVQPMKETLDGNATARCNETSTDTHKEKQSLVIGIIDQKPLKVSNITPKKKPTWSDSLLPGLVQVLVHVVDRLEDNEKKQAEAPATEEVTSAVTTPKPSTTTPGQMAPAALAESDAPESPIITIVQLLPDIANGIHPCVPAIVIEVHPVKDKDGNGNDTSSGDKNGEESASPNPTGMSDEKHQSAHMDDTNDQVEWEGLPVVQSDVRVVNDETIPMTMVIDIVPSDTPDMADPDSAKRAKHTKVSDNTSLRVVTSAPEMSPKCRPKRDISPNEPATPFQLEQHKFVHYPTLYFSDEWSKDPGTDSGFLGYRDPVGDKDDADVVDEQDTSRGEVEDLIDSSDFDSLKDDGFLLSEIRGDAGTLTTSRFKPSKVLKKIVKLRFALSSEAKRQNFSKFQGYSESVMSLLKETSGLSGADQLGVLLTEVISRGEIKAAKTLRVAKEALHELERADSPLSKALEGIPALNYT